MNRRVELPTGVAIPPSWSERNQLWLTQRLGFWRERLEAQAAGTMPPVGGPELVETDFEPAAWRVATLLGLSSFERELLVATAGLEVDASWRDAVARAQADRPGQSPGLSFALALALLPGSHWDALAPQAPLRHWSLLDVDASAGFGRARLRVDERVLHEITGVAAFDDRLTGLAEFDDLAAGEPQLGLADRIAEAIVVAGGAQSSAAPAPLVLLGAVSAAQRRAGRALARAVLENLGLRCLCVSGGSLPADARSVTELARRIDREAAFAGAGVALLLEGDNAARQAASIALAARLHTAVVLLVGAPNPDQLADLGARRQLRFTVAEPVATLHADLALTLRRAAEPALQQFRVEPAVFDQSLASAAGAPDEPSAALQLWDSLREAARGGLDALAQRVASLTGFDDLVLPPFVTAQLHEIASQLTHRHRVYEEWGFGARQSRGLGLAALFAGESGTGKTLAAEAIANEARLDLYRIDLASTVSKYIGETEKNLARLFDAAQRSGAVLLFDEADALFGKRSDVKDSHDRYANIEIAYLLQRIESYRGLAILTTNMKSALDPAFLRRIRFVVQFPFPDAAARAQIWQRVLPAAAPTAGLDLVQLGRLNVAGGSIRNIAINAAFIAAGRAGAIDPACIAAAAQAEFAKLERSVGAGLAGWAR